MSDELHVLCHELRGALAPVVALARMLQKPGLTAEQAREAGEIIERNALVLTRLASDLAGFGTGHHASLEVTYVDLGDVVRAAVRAMTHVAEIRGVTLTAQLGQEAIVVVGDAARLSQVLSNLLDNALKFTDPGGAVDVALTVDTDRAQLTVSDTGRGIDPDFLPRIFEKFARAGNSAGGSGLGLYVVKRFVELHGGTVEAHSAGAGHGSRFVVVLRAKMTAVA